MATLCSQHCLRRIETNRAFKSAPTSIEIVDDDLGQSVGWDLADDARAALTPPGAPVDRRTPFFSITEAGLATLRFDP